MNWFDIFIFIIIIASFISGYINGIIKQLASIAGIVLGVLFSGQLAGFISPFLQKIIGDNTYWANPLAYTIAFLGIFITVMLIGKGIHKFAEAIKIGFLNRLAGGVLSSAKYLLLISILVYVIQAFDFKEKIIDKEVRNDSYFYPYVNKIGAYFVVFLSQENASKE